MIIRKTPEEIEAMASAGDIVAGCLAMLRGMCRPGVTTADLDRAGDKFIRARGGEPAFMGYRGFPASICTSPNSMVVHGIPGEFELSAGDLLSIDVGVEYEGWVADAALTVALRPVSPVAATPAEGDPRVARGGGRAVPPRQPPRATSRMRSRSGSRRRAFR